MSPTRTVTGERRWPLRTVPAELDRRYRAEGHWTDDTLGEMVAEGVSTRGDQVFDVHSRTRPWHGTFAEVDLAARRFAGRLHDEGIGPGDVVVFQLPNWVEAAIAFWGAAYLGAVVVPVVHFYGPKEVEYVLGTTAADVFVSVDRFGATDHLERHAPIVEHCGVERWLVVGDDPEPALPAGARSFASLIAGDPLEGPLATDPSSPALIGFTSGTTSDPKGVIHTHRTIGFETRQLEASAPDGGPGQITAAPVGHFIGMLTAFLVPLVGRREVHLVDVWDPGEVLRLMREERLSMGGGATYFLTSLLDHPDVTDEHLALMPYAGLGGSPVPSAVTERAEALGIAAYRAYGSTEHPSTTSTPADGPADKRLHTDGRPLPGVEVRLDEHGQIHSRGPDCFAGYTDPELTDAVFDDDGWYRTGDVGVLDEDGYLTITDRISDVIIRGGENVSAAEVEEQLIRLEAVAEVAVVAEPDERLGERAVAVLRVRPGAVAPSLEDVRQHLGSAGLAKQKWPERVHVVEELPRTPSGKLKKFEIRRLVRDGSFGSDD